MARTHLLQQTKSLFQVQALITSFFILRGKKKVRCLSLIYVYYFRENDEAKKQLTLQKEKKKRKKGLSKLHG